MIRGILACAYTVFVRFQLANNTFIALVKTDTTVKISADTKERSGCIFIIIIITALVLCKFLQHSMTSVNFPVNSLY